MHTWIVHLLPRFFKRYLFFDIFTVCKAPYTCVLWPPPPPLCNTENNRTKVNDAFRLSAINSEVPVLFALVPGEFTSLWLFINSGIILLVYSFAPLLLLHSRSLEGFIVSFSSICSLKICLCLFQLGWVVIVYISLKCSSFTVYLHTWLQQDVIRSTQYDAQSSVSLSNFITWARLDELCLVLDEQTRRRQRGPETQSCNQDG